MSVSEEEPYSTIFASLKHPIRRRILRMLSEKPMSFSEMLEVLGVSSSFLTYHLENLGELVGKIDDGKYRLSSFGEAAMATMTKVEDIPTTTQSRRNSETRSQKWPRPLGVIARAFKTNGAPTRKGIVVLLGIVCLLLVVCLAGVIANYTLIINDKNNTISSLDTKISSLTSSVTNLRRELNGILNRSISPLDIVTSDPSTWVNRTVVVEGIISPFLPPGWWWPPWNYELNSSGTTIGVSWQGSFYNGENVTVRGVVTEGRWNVLFANGTVTLYGPVVYFIEAESIEPL